MKNAHLWLQLVRQLAGREIQLRYRGSFLGVLWSIVTPLAMLLVFTFVFGVIFKSRWGGADENIAGFALVMFAGLIVFNLFSDVVSRAPTLIVGQANLVKKVVFPLELLPVISLCSALVQAGVAMAVLVAAQVVMGVGPKWTLSLLPIVILPACLVTLGLAWFLAALGVYVRDISHIVPPALTATMFLTPVFFPVESLPDWLQPYLMLNPLAYAVQDVRSVVVFGEIPAVAQWLTGLALCGLVAFLGYLFFVKTRKGFADVL